MSQRDGYESEVSHCCGEPVKIAFYGEPICSGCRSEVMVRER